MNMAVTETRGRPRKPLGEVPKVTRSDQNQMSATARKRVASSLRRIVRDQYGSIDRFSKALGLTRQGGTKWLRTGVVPAVRVVDLVKVVKDEKITPEFLRPDVFKKY